MESPDASSGRAGDLFDANVHFSRALHAGVLETLVLPGLLRGRWCWLRRADPILAGNLLLLLSYVACGLRACSCGRSRATMRGRVRARISPSIHIGSRRIQVSRCSTWSDSARAAGAPQAGQGHDGGSPS